MEELIPTDRMDLQAPDPSEFVTGKVLRVRRGVSGLDFDAMLGQALQYVNLADIAAKIKAGTQYVVQIPTEFQAGMDSGKYFIMQGKESGIMWPELVEITESGRQQIVTPLPIKGQQVFQGNPVQELANGYQLICLQNQIKDLSRLIEDTLHTVTRIEHGQLDDRIGRLNAGKEQMIFALNMPEGEERSRALAAARQDLFIAHEQIAVTLQRRVQEFEPLPKHKVFQYLRNMANTGYLSRKDDEYREAQDYYDLYMQATKMLAASYVIVGEEKNAQLAFERSADCLAKIDYSNLSTIQYAHKADAFYGLYDYALEEMPEEKQKCLEEASHYNTIAIEVSGNDLLEVLSNGGEKTAQQKIEQG